MATKTSVVLLDEKRKPAVSKSAGYMERESTSVFQVRFYFIRTYLRSIEDGHC